MSLDLDMLVVAWTCPYQSWQNIVDRVMSALNLALMDVSVARKELPQDQERFIHNRKTLTEVREVAAHFQKLTGLW